MVCLQDLDHKKEKRKNGMQIWLPELLSSLKVPKQLLNPRDEVVNISKGTTIARMELLPVDSVTTLNKEVRGISRVTDAQFDNV